MHATPCSGWLRPAVPEDGSLDRDRTRSWCVKMCALIAAFRVLLLAFVAATGTTAADPLLSTLSTEVPLQQAGCALRVDH